jgi:AraC-like DNA-binding protein/mannose-6-phosphate isomerase-like protein (cupin superfamily)
MEEEVLAYSRMPVSAWLATFGDPCVREPVWSPTPPNGENRLVFHSHIHDEIEVHQIRRGELTAEINGSRLKLTAGDILIVNPYERHSGTVPQNAVTEYLHATYDVNYFTGCCGEANTLFRNMLSGEIYFPTLIPADNPVSPRIGKALENIYECYRRAMCEKENLASADLRLSLAVQELTALLLENVTPLKSNGKQVRNSRFIREVQQYVSNYFRCNLTTEQIANDIGYNTSYFCTMFRQNFGIPFKQYLNERRIEYATTWLRNLPLSEIASALGFSSYNYFCRVFKKQTGMTPGEMFGRCE